MIFCLNSVHYLNCFYNLYHRPVGAELAQVVRSSWFLSKTNKAKASSLIDRRAINHFLYLGLVNSDITTSGPSFFLRPEP